MLPYSVPCERPNLHGDGRRSATLGHVLTAVALRYLDVCFVKQGHALVGRSDAPQHQDIQLSGLGIMPEHAVVDISDSDVYITPLPGARCVPSAAGTLCCQTSEIGF